MPSLDLDLLLAACATGGPSCLTSTTTLRPAGGEHTSVAPAKYVTGSGSRATSTYVYERRYLGGVSRHTVLIDSKQSQLNRVEAELEKARLDGHPVLSRLPHVEVAYETGGGGRAVYSDLVLPHRVFDAHVRAGRVGDVPTTATPEYRAVRDASPADASALLDTSPLTLVLGGWDSSRKSRQGRWRSALVGEVIGFVATAVDRYGHDDGAVEAGRRGGARIDPVGMRIQVPGSTLQALATDQRAELSTKNYETVTKAAAAAKKDRVGAAELGFGGIPPLLEQLGGVACHPVLRTHVLSFATLRQMRFGPDRDAQANEACRALLAALVLAGLARSDGELHLRANCDLVESAPTRVTLDQRGGNELELEALDVAGADGLLAAALQHAERVAGVQWSGVTLQVTGNPEVQRGAESDRDAEEEG